MAGGGRVLAGPLYCVSRDLQGSLYAADIGPNALQTTFGFKAGRRIRPRLRPRHGDDCDLDLDLDCGFGYDVKADRSSFRLATEKSN